MRRLLLATVLLASAAGCNDTNFTAFDQVDVWQQNPPDEVDILLVVDNSCSMEPYQTKLGANFTQFISWFIEADVDYQIGVVTTDIIDTRTAGAIQGPIITADTANPEGQFSANVNVGTGGAAFEAGIEAAHMALTTKMNDGTNAGFLRDDASLSIIFVSDEEDSSPYGVNNYINEFVDIKGARNRDVFNASALVVSDYADCTSDQQAVSTIGSRYMDVAQQTGGIVGNLCDNDFESIVFDLSLASTRLRNIYWLSDEPNLTTLEVSIDDEIIPCADGRWSYDEILDESSNEVRPAIVFDPAQMPPVGSKIAARYFAGGADPAEFCQGGE